MSFFLHSLAPSLQPSRPALGTPAAGPFEVSESGDWLLKAADKKPCRWLREKEMELRHFLGLFRVTTGSEVVGCREFIEYDEPRTAKR